MSDIKCPFCQQEIYYADTIDGGFEMLSCYCKKDMFGNDKLWQALIDTKKKLDIAVDALDAGKTLADVTGFKMLAAGLEKALEQIKQKEEK